MAQRKDPDSKVHGANMGPIWGREDPGGPHVGPMKFAIWGLLKQNVNLRESRDGRSIYFTFAVSKIF